MRPQPKKAFVATLVLACSVSVPVLLPPPFGQGADGTTNPQLFFPTGLAVAPSGWLVVNNANFDRGFDSGTMLSLSIKDAIEPLYAPLPAVRTDDCAVPDSDAGQTAAPDYTCYRTLPATVTKQNAVMVSSFGGPIAFDQTGLVAYTGSRASSLVTTVQLDPNTGALTCWPQGGQDCRGGMINTLLAANLEGPYGVAPGVARLPGDSADQQVMFVSSLVPHIDSIIDNQLQTYGRVAALVTGQPQGILFTAVASTPITPDVGLGSAGVGAGPILFDASRRQIILGGCYQRFGAGSSGDPSTGKCNFNTLSINPIRFISVDSGPNPAIQTFDLRSSASGTETTSLVLGGEDATGVPQILYATSRTPDTMVEIKLPPFRGQDPVVRRVTALPLSPAGAIRLQRPAAQPGSDLIAVAGSGNSTISIYDAFQGAVVAQVTLPPDVFGNPLDSPFTLAQLPSTADGKTARFVASIFGSCQLAFFDLDFATPWDARLRSVVGKCP